MAEREDERERISARIHILEGLAGMLERDDLHRRLRQCSTVREAIELLTGPDFRLSEVQARHTLDASNRRYVEEARDELQRELAELRRQRAELDAPGGGDPDD